MASRNNVIVPCLNKSAETELWASNFARQIKASLIILKQEGKKGLLSKFIAKKELKTENSEAAHKRAEYLAQKFDIEVHLEWVQQSYADILPELIKKHNAGFIVLNALTEEGKYNPQVSKILAKTEISVISLRPGIEFESVRHVLLPLDLTPESRQKVSKALGLARLFRAEVSLFSNLWDVDDKEIRMRLQLQMKQVRSFLMENKIKVHQKLTENPDIRESATPTLQYLKDHEEINMLLIMARSNSVSLLNKPSAELIKIISSANVPVLCVVPKIIGDTSMRSF